MSVKKGLVTMYAGELGPPTLYAAQLDVHHPTKVAVTHRFSGSNGSELTENTVIFDQADQPSATAMQVDNVADIQIKYCHGSSESNAYAAAVLSHSNVVLTRRSVEQANTIISSLDRLHAHADSQTTDRRFLYEDVAPAMVTMKHDYQNLLAGIQEQQVKQTQRMDQLQDSIKKLIEMQRLRNDQSHLRGSQIQMVLDSLCACMPSWSGNRLHDS